MSTTTKQMDDTDWRSLPMVDQMQHLLDTGELSDVTFVVGEDDDLVQRISAHKLLLSRASEVFLAMFTGGLQEKGEVRVTDITSEAFKSMLQFIYTEKIELCDIDTSLQVTLAAVKYQVKPLLRTCVNFIQDKIVSEDVFKVFDFANLIENDQLKQVCLKMLQEKTEEVLSATSWVSSPSTFVMTLLQQDTLNVSSELPLLTACQRWARHQVDMDDTLILREVMNPLLPYLRLRTMTTEQFITYSMDEKCIFTLEERMLILQCIVKPELKIPDGLCEVTTHRLTPITEKQLMAAVVANFECNSLEDFDFKYEKTNLNLPPIVFYNKSYHVLVFGVTYCTVKSSKVDVLVRIANNNKYKEHLTVQLLDKQTGDCVTSLSCEETVGYDIYKILHFSKPYLMKKGFHLELRVIYHTAVHGQRGYYWVDKSDYGDLLVEQKSGVLGVCKIKYKVIY